MRKVSNSYQEVENSPFNFLYRENRPFNYLDGENSPFNYLDGENSPFNYLDGENSSSGVLDLIRWFAWLVQGLVVLLVLVLLQINQLKGLYT